MKNLIFMLLLAGSIGGVYAQNAEKKDKFSPYTPLFEELTNVKKKTDKFNLYLIRAVIAPVIKPDSLPI